MCEVKKQWVVENGEGHYIVWNDYRKETCDKGELHELVKEMKQDGREVRS